MYLRKFKLLDDFGRNHNPLPQFMDPMKCTSHWWQVLINCHTTIPTVKFLMFVKYILQH